MLKLPGLVDVHVHMREPGAAYKEDWDTGTQAALAGGITTVLAMPNTTPPVVDNAAFRQVWSAAESQSRCDWGLYVGAGDGNAKIAPGLAKEAVALKMYLDATFGLLRLDDMQAWLAHFESWPHDLPIVAHAEGKNVAAIILLAKLFNRSVHIAHLAKAEEIAIIRKAKEQGIAVTCEVAPHHLFLNSEFIEKLGSGPSEVRPRLATPADSQALWDNLEFIDCFATDHAPHTVDEKRGDSPPPGFPGLETALPLLLTAVRAGKLSIEDIIQKYHTNPSTLFHLPEQPETWIEVDETAEWTIHGDTQFTKCKWTPFEGWMVTGRVEKVVLRGETAFENGQVLAKPGSGHPVKSLGTINR